jgi:hypothetical protein
VLSGRGTEKVGREAGGAGVAGGAAAAFGDWGFDGTEDGSGGAVGEVAVAWGFAEGAAVDGESGEGEVAGLGGGVGGAAVCEFVGRGEEFADGGLGGPDDELAEGELVDAGDFDEWDVALKEVVEDLGGVEGDAVDLVVDGLREDFVVGREHAATVPGAAGKARGREVRE